MKIHLNGNEVDCEAYSLSYGGGDEDLLNGVLINMPEHYIFLSDHVEIHRELMEDDTHYSNEASKLAKNFSDQIMFLSSGYVRQELV